MYYNTRRRIRQLPFAALPRIIHNVIMHDAVAIPSCSFRLFGVFSLCFVKSTMAAKCLSFPQIAPLSALFRTHFDGFRPLHAFDIIFTGITFTNRYPHFPPGFPHSRKLFINNIFRQDNRFLPNPEAALLQPKATAFLFT